MWRPVGSLEVVDVTRTFSSPNYIEARLVQVLSANPYIEIDDALTSRPQQIFVLDSPRCDEKRCQPHRRAEALCQLCQHPQPHNTFGTSANGTKLMYFNTFRAMLTVLMSERGIIMWRLVQSVESLPDRTLIMYASSDLVAKLGST